VIGIGVCDLDRTRDSCLRLDSGLRLIVSDTAAARAHVIDLGAGVSEACHDVGGVFDQTGEHEARIGRPDADRPDWRARNAVRERAGAKLRV
jgi:hypothetical protein